MATTTSIKVILTKAGTEYSATQQYRLLDYIVVDDTTMYVCRRVDPTTMTCVGHPLTDSDYWDKCVDLSEAQAKAVQAAANAQTAADTANATNTAVTEAETKRVSAESSRATAESARASAEQARQTAETIRASAESSRASAEESRVEVEAARVTAEEKRQTDTAQAISDSDAQTAIAKSYNEHPPKIGDNNHWWTWNGTEYVDTGNRGRGDTLYPTFSHEGNKLYMTDTGGTLNDYIKKEGNKLTFEILDND